VATALIGVPGRLGVRAQGRRRGCAAGMEAGCGSVRAHGWLGRGEGDDRRAPPGSETRGKAVEWAGWANWASKRRAACLIRRWAEGGLAGLGKRKPLLFSRELTKFEFKHKFEFKQTKTMQQHVCNSRLL
jgi:hypothetical protein